MNYTSVQVILISIILATLPGCTRIIDWTLQRFYQGEPRSVEWYRVRDHIRTVRINNQLQARAIFDALWLNKAVRDYYASVIACKYCKTEYEYQALCELNNRELSQYISFYVSSLYEIPLSLAASRWALVLQIDNGPCVSPVEVIKTELTPEWGAFFSRRHSRFKQAYLVKFDAFDDDDQPLITATSRWLTLYVRSLNNQAGMTWPIDVCAQPPMVE